MFVGRQVELDLLHEFHQRRTAGLAVCRGRRRIGKSTLIEKFGLGKRFLEFYGLPPRNGITNQDQLNHFGRLMGTAFNVPAMRFENWHQALSTLAGLTAEGEAIIFLDEISWLASKDKDFPGILKGVWDVQFKKNEHLRLILCGSVTSWIDDNILNDRGFMGRVSLTLTLDELPLHDANRFWENRQISASEKLKLLCVTGGIPRYLEEIQPNQTAEQNIKRMCFSPEGFLFSEFDKIFTDVFQRRSGKFKEIVKALAGAPLEPADLCNTLGIKPTGGLSSQLSDLATSGMVARDYTWSPTGRKTSRSKYRISDNYLRFYLRYIDSQKEKIEKGLYRDIHLENLPNWKIILGLQFENLILNNLPSIIALLAIPPESIVSASPYFQRKTRRHEACQIDLLIQTRHTIYICEIRFRERIEGDVADEVLAKAEKLPGKTKFFVRPVLIYEGELAPKIGQSDVFAHIVPVSRLFH